MFSVKIPLISSFLIGTNKVYTTLNEFLFTGLSFHVRTKIKKEIGSTIYYEIFEAKKTQQIPEINDSDSAYSLSVYVYKGDLRRFDLDNCTPIFIKIFLDQLVKTGLIKDDNSQIINSIHTYILKETNPAFLIFRDMESKFISSKTANFIVFSLNKN